MSIDTLQALIWATVALLGGVAGLTLLWQIANRARVGPVRLRRRRRRKLRALMTLGALILAVITFSEAPLGRTTGMGALLALSVLLIAASPGFQDSIWGQTGVQRGWYARRFSELEAWRLVGEHLRWRLFGNWVSTDVPPQEHAKLRLLLDVQAPGRESEHGNAGFDPQRAAAKSNS